MTRASSETGNKRAIVAHATEVNMNTVNITPNWEGTIPWFAHMLAEHGFERAALSPVISFIEQVRFLSLTDPEAMERVLRELRRKDDAAPH